MTNPSIFTLQSRSFPKKLTELDRPPHILVFPLPQTKGDSNVTVFEAFLDIDYSYPTDDNDMFSRLKIILAYGTFTSGPRPHPRSSTATSDPTLYAHLRDHKQSTIHVNVHTLLGDGKYYVDYHRLIILPEVIYSMLGKAFKTIEGLYHDSDYSKDNLLTINADHILLWQTQMIHIITRRIFRPQPLLILK